MIFLFVAKSYFINRLRRSGLTVFISLFGLLNTVYAEPFFDAKTLSVTIVQSEDSGSYVEFSEALSQILSDKGIAHLTIDLSKPIPNSGLVVAVGMKAAMVVANSNAPAVLNVLIPKSGFDKLLQDFTRRATSHYYFAIVLDQPFHRQAHLIAALLPGKHDVGLLYSSPPNELTQLRDTLTTHGFNLHEQLVNPALPLAESLQNILHDSEMLLALPDAVVYNSSTIRNILLATYRSGVPVIGISAGYVKAGALCAVFSTPLQIAAQAATQIRRFGETHALPTVQYPQEFEVMVNEQVARSLGLQIKSAQELHEIISAEIRRNP